MYIIQVALFVLCYFNYCYCLSTRVWHNKNCGKQGFTCAPGNKALIYECPVRTKEYHVYINEFNGPSNLESLLIRNCKTLTILLRCTKYKQERKRLKYLKISNIERLKIQGVKHYHSQLPPEVVFENIKFIEKIPSYSFSQVDKKLNKVRCILPLQNFNSIYFRNVTINAVYSSAFYMPNNFGNVTFTDVRINNMEASAVIVNHNEGGVFLFDKSAVQALKPFSFQIVGKRATFSESKFVSVPPSGINATIETFNFVNNSVKTLHSRALSILASNVHILHNRFDSLKAGAFEQIGPRKFGKSKFTYDFSQNDINFMDASCLHPDLIAQENVASKFSFSGNRLSCVCDKLVWLLSKLDRSNGTTPMEKFYKIAFDEENGNICSSSCNLPLMAARGMIKNGKCLQDVSVQWLCDNKDHITTVSIASESLSSIDNFTSSVITPTASSVDTKNNDTFRVPIPTIEKYKQTHTYVDDLTLSNSGVTSTSFPNQRPKMNASDEILTTANFMMPTLKITNYSSLGTPLYTTAKSKQTGTFENHLTFANSGVTSSLVPNKIPIIKTTAFDALTILPEINKITIPDKFEFVNSVENCSLSFLLLVCSVLCIVIIG